MHLLMFRVFAIKVNIAAPGRHIRRRCWDAAEPNVWKVSEFLVDIYNVYRVRNIARGYRREIVSDWDRG